MKHKRKKKLWTPAIVGVSTKLKGIVVSAWRAKKKAKSQPPTERQVRALRFLAQRTNLAWEDRHSLNTLDLGGLICRGYVFFQNGQKDGSKLRVSDEALEFVHNSRQRMNPRARVTVENDTVH